MGTFFKTFFVCTLVAFLFLAYKYFGSGSFDETLEVSSSNPVFSKKSDDKYLQVPSKMPVEHPDEQKTVPDTADENPKQVITQNKYVHTCYFYAPNGKLMPYKRELSTKPSLENIITLLLKGPLISETKQGVYSEIPNKVDLISLKRKDNSIIVNLTDNFGSGGGSQSIENRVKQLSKTIKAFEPDKNVYLYINNSEVEYLGGDGVYIKQPLD